MANRKGTARADAVVVAGKTGSRAAGQAPRKHKKTALWKDIRRSIAYSKGRFISIMLLMMLGSFALVGLFVAGPDMRATGETYFNEYSLSDLTVMSDYGLDGEDVSTINKTQGAAAIDSHIGKDYPIGSTIKLDEKPSSLSDKNVLRDDEYTVVGYVHTPEIISIVNMGQSTAGTGSLKGCGVVVEDEFDLADARARLAKLSMPNYEAGTRREALGSEAYKTYDTVSEIIDSLAGVFPVLLYVVAAFVTLSTMTRMVDEERINSGTLKALGYHDRDVALKFVLYGALAGGIGTVLGIILGHTLLPWIVYSAYGPKFTLPPIHLGFYPVITVVAILLAGLCAVLPAVLAVRHELGEKPAALLLPKPPKGGSKIMLEHIRPVWSRMSFTHKVTARNLFRYKQRMFMTVLGVAGANNDTQEISMIVPEDDSQLDDYLDLHNRKTEQKLELGSDGCVISERLASLLGIGVGDQITFNDSDGVQRTTTVTGVCEMYMGHFIVMSHEAFENCYGKNFDPNAAMIKLKDGSLGSVENAAADIMKQDAVKSVVQNTSMQSQVETVVASLNKIIGILILVAALLAIVIMYNLTNLNVGERMRELSTIKVLGFHSNETTMYIYRETILRTALGLLFGYVLGVGMHEYILNVVPPDNVMFNPDLAAIEFIVPAIVIAAITLVLYFVELRRLSTVDMLEALKSVE